MDALPDYGWPTVIVAVLALASTIIGAVLAGRKHKQEKLDEAERERRESAAAGDLDLEHLDRERLERLRNK
jgi:heme exporter protein D